MNCKFVTAANISAQNNTVAMCHLVNSPPPRIVPITAPTMPTVFAAKAISSLLNPLSKKNGISMASRYASLTL